ncbi:hypothetical protein AK812_SmicGene40338 [Symbiodinium microadriaticum]|uniref:Uncharacterized protein n=1 Tax=Symbiodinium microadriaticum TaxID=2951 RepID=A0A1Q9C906_SYMMI|nr:hypothetical protein AK812_SmicGene40338 [Symbiodinium microadriaticum]
MKSGSLAAVITDAGQPARDYEARKRTPRVRAWKELGEQLSARTGDPTSETADQLLQALAVTLQRENARAVLRRQGLPDADLRFLPEP